MMEMPNKQKNPLICKNIIHSLEVVFVLYEKGFMRILGDGNAFAK